jgi:hypothetical protein
MWGGPCFSELDVHVCGPRTRPFSKPLILYLNALSPYACPACKGGRRVLVDQRGHGAPIDGQRAARETATCFKLWTSGDTGPRLRTWRSSAN